MSSLPGQALHLIPDGLGVLVEGEGDMWVPVSSCPMLMGLVQVSGNGLGAEKQIKRGRCRKRPWKVPGKVPWRLPWRLHALQERRVHLERIPGRG